jgi:hypothetical protein
MMNTARSDGGRREHMVYEGEVQIRLPLSAGDGLLRREPSNRPAGAQEHLSFCRARPALLVHG